MQSHLPRRSALYVPASNSRAVEKARTLRCDVVILDLEDSVAPELKQTARENAVTQVASGDFVAREVVIRVNSLDSEWGVDDMAAVAPAACDAILLPKISTAADITRYRDHLGDRLGDRSFWVMIETAQSLFRLEEIASTPGVAAMVFGGNDLAKELNTRSHAAREAFSSVLVQIVAAGRAFGVAVLDGVFNNIEDLEGFENECREAADIGFDGKTLIHPAQVLPCEAAFAPTTDEIAWAMRVREGFNLPENSDKGAIRLDGRMVERLHLHQALLLLEKVANSR